MICINCYVVAVYIDICVWFISSEDLIPSYDASDMKACCIKISVYILAIIIGCSWLTH